MIRPRLVGGARLIYDPVRGERMLLVPEGIARLNGTAAAVLELCDGKRSLDEIIHVLADRYDVGDLRADVHGLIAEMTERGLVVDAAE